MQRQYQSGLYLSGWEEEEAAPIEERPYRERHRVELSPAVDTPQARTWQRRDREDLPGQGQGRVIRGNAPGRGRSTAFAERLPDPRRKAASGPGAEKKEISTDLLLLNSRISDRQISNRQFSDRHISDRRNSVRQIPGRQLSDRQIPDRQLPDRQFPDRQGRKTGQQLPQYRTGRQKQPYPDPGEDTGEREESVSLRKRKREQARRERARQVRRFYLMAGCGILLVSFLAVFALVSLLRGGSKKETDPAGERTESSASGNDPAALTADKDSPDTEAAEAEGAEQTAMEAGGEAEPDSLLTSEKATGTEPLQTGEHKEEVPEEGTEITGESGQSPQQNEAAQNSGQQDGGDETGGLQSGEQVPQEAGQSAGSLPGEYAHQDDWHLLVVNPWKKLPEGYTVQTTVLPNGESVDSRCYDELMKMLEDCRAGGGEPIVCSSYRTHEKQIMLYENQVNSLISQGLSREEALKEAGTVVAVPGTSEHELGLAVDICDTENQLLDESQADTNTQKWLMENSWKYGFILRYPPEKSAFTGIIFEPWHYRYVGTDAAAQIRQSGMCLEEYLSQ